jgi:hypothetical protein
VFVKSRLDAAIRGYDDAVESGNLIGAGELARQIMFSGLHFSKFDIVKDIIDEHYTTDDYETITIPLAKKILPACETVFEQYYDNEDGTDFTDLFAAEVEYDYLTADLVRHIGQILGK